MTTELIWQHLDSSGWEHVRVIPDHPGWTVFDSILVREHEGLVLRGGYTLVIDKQWRTLELRLMIESSPGTMEGIHLLTEGDGHWTDANDNPIPELNGCLDVDIQWSPLTNSLPVNRLNLGAEEERDISVAYISLPDLTVMPFNQQYQRLTGTDFRYSDQRMAAPLDFSVDAHGYVTGYPTRFSRTWPNE